MVFPSKQIEEAVIEISKLPGIGKKTALRLILHLLKQDAQVTADLTSALNTVRLEIRYCRLCHNISDSELCSICSNLRRDRSLVCVVENLPDVFAIENTGQFNGTYHVLGGVISPIAGIAPNDLNVDSLINRVSEGNVAELILALSPTMEGDTTAYYIVKKIKEFNMRITTIARGVPIGGEIEFTDEITLGRSILTRTIFTS